MPLTLGLAAMATRFELVLDDREPVATRAAGEAALAEIAEAERRLSRFRSDALPAQLERSAAGDAAVTGRLAVNAAAGVVVARDEFALLELCRRACARTGRAFDPAHGGAPFSSWSIDRRGRRIVAPPGSARPDFGGVGKGWALDRAIRVLREAGVSCALLHGGTSSVTALGAPPDARAPAEGWRVALRDPVERDRVLATVALRDAALSVSAPHGRLREVDGRVVGHVIDPRDGVPVERARLAAVVARRGAVAEIASTALLVLAERALRRGESVTAAALAPALPPSITALVAWEDHGELRSACFGPSSDRFRAAHRERALMEACR